MLLEASVNTALSLDDGRPGPPVLVLGVPVAYVPQGKPQQILADLGLDARGIATTAAKAYGRLMAARLV